MKGLIIRDPWITKILAGTKTWEMRTKPALYRGRVALIRKGTGMAFGTAELVDSLPPLDAESFRTARERHGIPAEMDVDVLRDGWVYPWVLQNVQPLQTPVSVDQKSGAVIWVTLTHNIISKIEEQRLPVDSLTVNILTVTAKMQNPARYNDEETALPLIIHNEKKAAECQSRNTSQTLAPPISDTRARILPSNANACPFPVASTSRLWRDDEAIVELTAGAIRNGNVSVRSALSWLPDDVLGGSSKNASAKSSLTVVFVPGETVETDVASDKMLLRCRGAVLDFFERSGAKPGNRVRIRRQEHRTLRVELER